MFGLVVHDQDARLPLGGARRRHDHLVAQLADQRRQLHRAAGAGRHVGRCSGSENENVLPCPSSLSTQIRPPWCSTISRQIGRPRPVPFGLSVSVSPTCLKRSNTFGWSAGAMPMPVSMTLTTIVAAAPRGAAGHRAGVGELDRVRDQVDDDLDQAIAIAGDRRQVRARRP